MFTLRGIQDHACCLKERGNHVEHTTVLGVTSASIEVTIYTPTRRIRPVLFIFHFKRFPYTTICSLRPKFRFMTSDMTSHHHQGSRL
jgi:hypothetical protein